MKININYEGNTYEINVTEWTKRPKANGIYVMIKNPVYGEILNLVKHTLEVSYNINIRTMITMDKSIGFVMNNSDGTLSVGMIMITLAELRKQIIRDCQN